MKLLKKRIWYKTQRIPHVNRSWCLYLPGGKVVEGEVRLSNWFLHSQCFFLWKMKVKPSGNWFDFAAHRAIGFSCFFFLELELGETLISTFHYRV